MEKTFDFPTILAKLESRKDQPTPITNILADDTFIACAL